MNVNKLIQKIEKHYLCHNVPLRLTLLETIGSYERFIFGFKLKPGTKENLIFDRAPDIQIALQLPLFQPFKDGLNVCLAVSEKPMTQNSLWDMLTSRTFRQSKAWLPIALGYDMRCEMVFDDLGKMPHAMYAGSTNSGKSVGLLCLILSLISNLPVTKVNIILFDVGANTMEPFNGVPHLSHPIVKDTETGIYVINALVEEMERRIKLDKDTLRKLPAIVVIMDEYVSLISNIGNVTLAKELTNSISNLLRRGRHGKVHLVLATQDPTIKNMKVDVGNITSRMAFACAKYHNSITILGEGGAEKLPGKGAMLYKSNEYPTPLRLQGAYMSPNDVAQLVRRITSAEHDYSNKFSIAEFDADGCSKPETEDTEDKSQVDDSENKELVDIILWTLGRDNISANQIKEQFRMGNRAYDIVEELFEMNLVTKRFPNQPKDVLPKCAEEIPEGVMELLLKNRISHEEINTIFDQRATTHHTH